MCFSKKLLHSKIVLVHFALKTLFFKKILFISENVSIGGIKKIVIMALSNSC